jgi:hypothetical protein
MSSGCNITLHVYRSERDKTEAGVRFEYLAEISLFEMNTPEGER